MVDQLLALLRPGFHADDVNLARMAAYFVYNKMLHTFAQTGTEYLLLFTPVGSRALTIQLEMRNSETPGF